MIIAKALEILGERILIGYDIGCTFQKTIETSSLGAQFKALHFQCCVNAFHGYAHNYTCQVKNHPNGIVGMGLEDLEMLEHVFSSSNQLAPITHYASAYHRQLFINMFFKQWDSDKYQNLGLMLYNNYVQALEILDTKQAALDKVMVSLQISEADLLHWHAEKKQYLATLGQEPDKNLQVVAYVELLQKLAAAK